MKEIQTKYVSNAQLKLQAKWEFGILGTEGEYLLTTPPPISNIVLLLHKSYDLWPSWANTWPDGPHWSIHPMHMSCSIHMLDLSKHRAVPEKLSLVWQESSLASLKKVNLKCWKVIILWIDSIVLPFPELNINCNFFCVRNRCFIWAHGWTSSLSWKFGQAGFLEQL